MTNTYISIQEKKIINYFLIALIQVKPLSPIKLKPLCSVDLFGNLREISYVSFYSVIQFGKTRKKLFKCFQSNCKSIFTWKLLRKECVGMQQLKAKVKYLLKMSLSQARD